MDEIVLLLPNSSQQRQVVFWVEGAEAGAGGIVNYEDLSAVE